MKIRIPTTTILILLASIKFLIHLFTNLSGGYGYFRDEFYYLACADHLSFGYVDHPPFSIALLWISRAIFGESLIALRLVPAVAGALKVLLTGFIVRELGGGRFAQTFAALTIIVVPVYLSMDNYFSMNSIDQLLWTVAAYLIVRLINTGNPKFWLLLGLVLGCGLQNKISVLWLGFGLFVGIILTPHRKSLLTKWLWLAAIIACTIFLPYIIWQIANGWPTLEFMHNATTFKMTLKSPLAFLGEQIVVHQPVLFPIAVIGLFWYFFSKTGKRFRLLGWLFVAVFALLAVNPTSKSYYLSPAYPIIFASGAFALEQFLQRFRREWLKTACVLLAIAGGVISAPLAIPILSEETYIRYEKLLGMSAPADEQHQMGKLPQFYADMHGWQEMVKVIADAYKSLSPEDQAQATIFADNYGEAGAIDFFGRQYHLPQAICRHNSYWLWGYGNATGEVAIVVGWEELSELQAVYTEVTLTATFTCEYCMPYENNLPIYICKGLRVPIKQLWQQLKVYI